MNKKIMSHILLICMVFIIGSIFAITEVNADSVAGLNVASSVSVGSTFTVALILPSDAYGAQCTITVTFSDGSTSSQNIVYVSGMDGYDNSTTFTASVAGNATINATGIVISNSSGTNIENGGSKSATISIVDSSSSSTTTSDVTFTDTNETVYTTEKVNIRSSYSSSSSKIATVASGTQLTRTGVGSNGWSRVSYNGQTAYVSTQYLTTSAPVEEEVTFTDVNDTMYAVQDCNLRKSWSTSSDIAGYLTAGEEVTRTGVASNGWSRITYNGNTVYVATRLLSSEQVESTNEVDENEVTEETIEGEKTELEILQEEIGVLPEVGNNIATRIYFIVTMIAISSVCFGIYYIKKDVK